MTDTPADLLFGVGVAAHLDCDRVLALRPFHPTGHAGFQLQVRVDDGVVVSADPRMGLMHRGAEKLFEARDYRQLMMLANRHDWLSAFSSELAVALTLEDATGITPPERATWTRTLLAEANRVAASLAFLGSVIRDTAHRDVALGARERLVAAQEYVTGGRVHPMFARIGGVATPLDAVSLDRYTAIVADLGSAHALIEDAVLDYSTGLAGLATLSRPSAIAFGTSGVVARAGGLDIDLRRDDAYLAYGELTDELSVPLRTTGDATARYALLLEQVPTSLRLMSACIDRLRSLGDGPVNVLLPKTVRVPEGVTHGWIEGPLGVTGCLLASVGEKTPWRLKIRSASFANAQALTTALVGTRVDDLADAVMSFFFVVGDVDR